MTAYSAKLTWDRIAAIDGKELTTAEVVSFSDRKNSQSADIGKGKVKPKSPFVVNLDGNNEA